MSLFMIRSCMEGPVFFPLYLINDSLLLEVMSETKKLPPSEVFADKKSGLKPGQYACPLEALRGHVARTGGISDSDNPDTQQRALRRCLQTLKAKCFIGILDDWAWLADKADKGGQS